MERTLQSRRPRLGNAGQWFFASGALLLSDRGEPYVGTEKFRPANVVGLALGDLVLHLPGAFQLVLSTTIWLAGANPWWAAGEPANVPLMPGFSGLSSDHVGLIRPFVEERIRRAHAVDPADFERWEENASACYLLAGLRFPRTVIKVSSPHAMFEAVMERSGCAGEAHEDGNVAEAIRRAIFGPLNRVVDELLPLIAEDLMAPISLEVGGAVGDALGRPLGRLVPLEGRCLGTWFNDEPESWFACLRSVVNLELGESMWGPADAFEFANDSAGIWWPHRDYVVVCDRPEHISLEPCRRAGLTVTSRRQARGLQLHATNGPALVWRDGISAEFEHGEHVDRGVQWFPPESGALLYAP